MPDVGDCEYLELPGFTTFPDDICTRFFCRYRKYSQNKHDLPFEYVCISWYWTFYGPRHFQFFVENHWSNFDFWFSRNWSIWSEPNLQGLFSTLFGGNLPFSFFPKRWGTTWISTEHFLKSYPKDLCPHKRDVYKWHVIFLEILTFICFSLSKDISPPILVQGRISALFGSNSPLHFFWDAFPYLSLDPAPINVM